MQTLQGALGSYECTSPIGVGGNGEVWRAQGPCGEVAVKILKKRSPPDAVPRFLREIEALQRLKDTVGVLPLLDADTVEAKWYAMPLATSLRERLGSQATLREVCAAVCGIAGALGRVHAREIVHRDIKPDNLYWYDGNWCLGDFGLADFEDAEPLTRSDRKLGPAYYIAPEMLNDAPHADGALADVYSLGKTIWVLATDQNFPTPGVHDPTIQGMKIRTYRDERRSDLLDELVRRMTQYTPKDRPTAEAVMRELAILAEEESITTPPDPTSSLDRLRVALVPHFTRTELDQRQQKLAEETARKVEQAIFRLVQRIRSRTGLTDSPRFSIPEFWRHRIQGATVKAESNSGYYFDAAAGFQGWRLAIGLKCQLFSDGNLAITAGYSFDRLVNGNVLDVMGGPQAWCKRMVALNGSPSAEKESDELIAGLEAHFPETIDLFTQLLGQASK